MGDRNVSYFDLKQEAKSDYIRQAVLRAGFDDEKAGQELLRFLFMISKRKDRYVPSQWIEKMWASLVLDTENYAKLCIHFNKAIDYHPDTTRNMDPKEYDKRYEATIWGYFDNFLEDPPERFWPKNNPMSLQRREIYVQFFLKGGSGGFSINCEATLEAVMKHICEVQSCDLDKLRLRFLADNIVHFGFGQKLSDILNNHEANLVVED